MKSSGMEVLIGWHVAPAECVFEISNLNKEY